MTAELEIDPLTRLLVAQTRSRAIAQTSVAIDLENFGIPTTAVRASIKALNEFADALEAEAIWQSS